MTIQHKTALLYTSITAVILLVMCFLTYFFTNTFAFRDFYKRLEIRAIITARAKFGNYEPSVAEAYTDIREQHLEKLQGEKEYFFKADSIAAFAATAFGSTLPPEFYNELKLNLKPTFQEGNTFYTGVSYSTGNEQYMVVLGAENTEYALYAKNLRIILIICFFSGILIAYASGNIFSRHTFKPVRDIIDKVETIEVENLHLRLEELESEDEVAVLTSTFNRMLSRLETAFETQNNFVSNASHELRTPLTAIYGEAEIALAKPRTEAGYIATLEIIVDQAEKLQSLTDGLLSLAQTGFDGKKQNFKLIVIEELVKDLQRTLNQLVPEHNVTFNLSQLPDKKPGTTVMGNYELLKLGISNIITNACKYSDNNAVDVTVTIDDNKVQIITRDTGIGIPGNELKFIYDPFFRASNTGPYKGYGIGLPLTRNIFRLHKGNILVTSHNENGTNVLLTLPLSK